MKFCIAFWKHYSAGRDKYKLWLQLCLLLYKIFQSMDNRDLYSFLGGNISAYISEGQLQARYDQCDV